MKLTDAAFKFDLNLHCGL